MINSIIFDWSGILSDDWAATFATGNDVLEVWGHRRLSEKEFRELYELPWINFYNKLGVEIDEKKEYALWEKIFPKHAHMLKPFPSAKEVLAKLKGEGKKILIFSAHNQNLLEKEIEEYGFKELIDAVNASNADKREKIEELIASHEIERENSIYVGDMCHDIETAKLAGVKSVAVLSGYDSREKLEAENPDYIIDDVGELPALLEKMGA